LYGPDVTFIEVIVGAGVGVELEPPPPFEQEKKDKTANNMRKNDFGIFIQQRILDKA
jgi:hypothetical protein